MIARRLAEAGFTELYLPKENAKEAALVKNLKVFGIQNLAELTHHLSPNEEREEKVLRPSPPNRPRKSAKRKPQLTTCLICAM